MPTRPHAARGRDLRARRRTRRRRRRRRGAGARRRAVFVAGGRQALDRVAAARTGLEVLTRDEYRQSVRTAGQRAGLGGLDDRRPRDAVRRARAGQHRGDDHLRAPRASWPRSACSAAQPAPRCAPSRSRRCRPSSSRSARARRSSPPPSTACREGLTGVPLSVPLARHRRDHGRRGRARSARRARQHPPRPPRLPGGGDARRLGAG